MADCCTAYDIVTDAGIEARSGLTMTSQGSAILERHIASAMAADKTRIADLEAALTLIVAGEADSGGNIRPRADAMQIAFKALNPND